MKEITTQKYNTTIYIGNELRPNELYEIILKDSETGELRYNKINIEGKTPDQLWDISEPCDYQKARSLEYPGWSEQFDDQYWDKKNGINIWESKIDNIKLKYPKPE